MKKFMMYTCATAMLLAAGYTSFSQSTKKPVTRPSIGVFGGVNFQNITGKDASGDKIKNNKLSTLYHAGINVDIPIVSEFYIQPGLMFNRKGVKFEDGDSKVRVGVSYLDIPVHFVYKPELGNGKLVLGIGPYIGFALSGKVKEEDNSGSATKSIKFKNSVTTQEYIDEGLLILKRFDAGGNLIAGYEFNNKISVIMNAQLGLIKINPKVSDLPSSTENKMDLKNVGFGLSVGYRF